MRFTARDRVLTQRRKGPAFEEAGYITVVPRKQDGDS
jgi:hypothetical protein